MTPPPAPPEDRDALIARFEAGWLYGDPGRIEDFLESTPDPALLAELLRIELTYRRRAGQTPPEDEYQTRFPGHAGLIASHFHPSGVTPAVPEPARTTGDEPLPPPTFLGAVGLCLLFLLAGVCALVPCYLGLRGLVAEKPRLVQIAVVAGCAMFLAGLVLLSLLLDRDWPRRLACRPCSVFHLLLVVLLAPPLLLVCAEAGNWATYLFGVEAPPPAARLGAAPLSFHRQLLAALAGEPWWLVLIVGCLMPAVSEEAFCRGYLGRGLVARKGVVAGVLLTSALFALLHIEPTHACAVLPGGIVLHIVYLTTRSLLAPVLLHALYNALVFWSVKLAVDGHDITGQYDARHLSPALAGWAALTTLLILALLYRTRACWALVDGQEWTPGYPTAEAPPAGTPAAIRQAPPGLILPALAAAVYFVFASLVFFHADPANAGGAHGHELRGGRLLDEGDLDGALGEFTRAITIDPTRQLSHASRGIAYYRKGENELALADFEQAIRLDPSVWQNFFNRSLCRYNLLRNEAAAEDCTEALRLAPEAPDVHGHRGLCYLVLKRYDEAIQDLTEALKRDPANINARVNRGHSYLLQNRDGEAIRDFDEAIRQDPKNANVYHLRGFAHDARGAKEQARADWEKALALDPKVADRFR